MRRSSRVYLPEDDSYRVALEQCGNGAPVIVDGGAHRGSKVDAFRALAPSAEFHCFEPDATLAADLLARFAEDQNVHVVAAALGEEPGTGVSVPVHVWEEAGRPRIVFVKMDVEGAEAAVIRGATDLLGTCRPTMLVEANSAEQLQILRTLLAPFGYQVEQPAGFAPHNFVFCAPQAADNGAPV